jgi:hypothetical protein
MLVMTEQQKDRASRSACNAIRKSGWYSDFNKHTDDELIELYQDEWSWYMEGWKDRDQLQPTKDQIKEEVMRILYKNSSDDSEAMRIKFEKVDSVVNKIVKLINN